MNYCLNCEKTTRNKFCSIICQKDYEYKKYIQEWKAGKVSGLRGEYQISMHIKTYLLKKYNNKCGRCVNYYHAMSSFLFFYFFYLVINYVK